MGEENTVNAEGQRAHARCGIVDAKAAVSLELNYSLTVSRFRFRCARDCFEGKQLSEATLPGTFCSVLIESM